jgi:hypothetical protein
MQIAAFRLGYTATDPPQAQLIGNSSAVGPMLAARAQKLTGNGANPTVVQTQLGSMSVAPLAPHFEQRAERRSMSLDASGPQRMISGAIAIGA